MKLYTHLKPGLIKIDCGAETGIGILEELLRCLKAGVEITEEEAILRKLLEREKLGSTSIGNHAAVPHTKLKGLREPVIAIGVSRKGLYYSESDTEPVHLVILILSPNNSPIIHLQILAAAASLIKQSRPFIDEVLECVSAEALIDIVRKYETTESKN